MRLEIFANLVAFFSRPKLFEEFGKAGINSACDRFRAGDVVATVSGQ